MQRYNHFLLILILTAFLLLLGEGCSRKTYRLWADRDAYHLIQSRQQEFSWTLPNRPVEPSPQSRLADLSNPDQALMPLDDAAAAQYMQQTYKFSNTRYWDRFDRSEHVDTLHWLTSLPYTEDGQLRVDRDQSVKLALLHSREYQDAVEQLYITALRLSENRFDFDVNWFGNGVSNFNASGEAPNARRTLDYSHSLGLNQSLASGGELMATLANSLVWEFGGNNFNTAAGSVLIGLTQPLLRGAFRHVRLETLTQSERDLLYRVRDFARFRRQFYLNVASDYLNLLALTQSMRNEQANLRSLELNLDEHADLAERDLVSQIQVAQVFQDYQNGRLQVLSAEQSLANALDAFKFRLGLPPYVEVQLDQGALKPFELNDPRLDQLQDQIEALNLAIVQYLPPEVPSRAELAQWFQQTAELQTQLQQLYPVIQNEMQQWSDRLDQSHQQTVDENKKTEFREFETIQRNLQDFEQNLQKGIDRVARDRAQLDTTDPAEAWKKLLEVAGDDLRAHLANLLTSQLTIRLYLIQLNPFELTSEPAIRIALTHRLDLMNQKGAVIDAFRQVEVQADSLQSDLTVSAEADVRTDPNHTNPIRFDSSANRYRLSVQFDGPLNRFSERNVYRTAQLQYQQARRLFMSVEDSIANDVRANLRALEFNRFDFEVARLQLLAAVDQVEEAQFNLRTSTSDDSSLTRDLLQALQSLLAAKNRLIASWVRYEISRMRVFVDLEILYLDDSGSWINETDDLRREPPLDESHLHENAPNNALEQLQPAPRLEKLPTPVDSTTAHAMPLHRAPD